MLWIKLTIIFSIIAICSYLSLKLMIGAMEPYEQLALAQGRYAPKRAIITCSITILSVIAAVVCLIIAILTW